MIEGRLEIDECHINQTTRVLNEGIGQIEDIGQTTGYFLKKLFDLADVDLLISFTGI